METIKLAYDSATVVLTHDELLVLKAALNEICNGIEVFEFSTRIGASRQEVKGLLKKFGALLGDMSKVPESGKRASKEMILEVLRHPWTDLKAAAGTASQLPILIQELASAESADEARMSSMRIDNKASLQGCLYECAPAVVSCAVAALQECTPHGRPGMLELVFDIANSTAVDVETEEEAERIKRACTTEMLRGVVIYFHFLESDRIEEVYACIDLLILCALADESLKERVIWTFRELRKRTVMAEVAETLSIAIDEVSTG